MNRAERFSFGQGAGPRGAGLWRGLASMVLGGLLLGLLAQRLQDIQPAQVQAALMSFSPQVWGLAALATGISFWAVGHYDDCVHRHLGTGQHGSRARRAGLAAIALSQTVGFGLVSGALVRWRMLPELNLWQATRVTATVTLLFLFCWFSLTSAVLMFVPAAPLAGWAGWGLTLSVTGAVMSVVRPGMGRGRIAAHLPNLFTLCRIYGWAMIDLGAAGLALWMFLPDGTGFLTLLPVFLLAFGAGILSGAPAGVGAFEATLFALLPMGAEALIAAVLAWRVLHYALPACLGAVMAGLAGHQTAATVATAATPQPDWPVAPVGCAEAGLIRQAELTLVPVAQGALICGQTPHGRVALRDPLGAVAFSTALTALMTDARAQGRQAVLYKASARFAVAARRAGFSALAVAAEAVLHPARFDLDTPARAGLRRKLRRAEKAGVRVTRADRTRLAELAAVNAAWVAGHGAELGFSMGRYEPDYLSAQLVFVAQVGGRIVGFASFHRAGGEWALDLLRPAPDAPDGTAQSLILAALRLAALEGIPRLSLAAVPRLGGRRPGRLLRRLGKDRRGLGLLQFKQGFAPVWEPLYLCAPNPAGVLIAAAELCRAIHFPPPLARKAQAAAEYEIASADRAWQRRGQP